MASNRLWLNPDKTQFIWFGTRQQLAKRNGERLSSVLPTLVSNTHVRNLGVILDSELLMGDHISQLFVPVFSSCVVCVRFATLSRRNRFSCSRTASSVTGSTTATASSTVQAGSNSTVSNPSWTQRRGSSWGYRSTPISRPAIRDELHWLPVRFRPEFKICLFVRNCLVGTAPAYLQELCVGVSSNAGRRGLRSASRGDLVVPRADTTRFGRRSISVSGPAIWNSLPLEVRQTMNNAE